MTIVEFSKLADEKKIELIVDADKVAEYNDGIGRYELFYIDNFFAEVKVSFHHKYRRIINTYSSIDVPLIYAGKLY